MSLQHKLGQKARRACCWLLSPPGVSCYENGSITSSFGQSCTRASPHNRRCSNHRPPIWSPPLAAARSQAARAPLGAGLKKTITIAPRVIWPSHLKEGVTFTG